jgi:hypothetical protein
MGFFGFGKKKRTTRRKTVSKKPPARLIRICKKYRVKATRKVGGKRVYKSIKVLKKLCLKKAYALKKKLMKMAKSKKGSKKTTRRRRKSRFGEDDEEEEDMSFGHRRSRFGQTMGGAIKESAKVAATNMGPVLVPKMGANVEMMGIGPRLRNFYDDCQARNGHYVAPSCTTSLRFGKRRRVGAKASRKTAMKAFSAFFKRHCAGRRGSRFGSGGNPPLSASMGYEFCPNGMGGVLGANSTGLFPSPCIGSAPMTGRSSSFGGYSMYPQFGMRRTKRKFGAAPKKRGNRAGCPMSKMKAGQKKKRAFGAVPKRRRKSMFGF